MFSFVGYLFILAIGIILVLMILRLVFFLMSEDQAVEIDLGEIEERLPQ